MFKVILLASGCRFAYRTTVVAIIHRYLYLLAFHRKSFVYVSRIMCMSWSVCECATECVYVLIVIEHNLNSEWVKSCVKS